MTLPIHLAVRPPDRRVVGANLTLIYVAYAVTQIDVSWVDPDDVVIVVHNDDALAIGETNHPRVLDILAPGNVGFGGAVNLALDRVETERVLLCNPDTTLTRAHRDAFEGAHDDEIVTVPLVDQRGQPTWVVQPYPGSAAAVAMGYRVGKLAGSRSGLIRNLGSRVLTRGGEPYETTLHARSGSWPLLTHWVSAAVMSIATSRLRAVGGFDRRYFLYMEDVDLSRRLAQRFPAMQVRIAETVPGCHVVGGSNSGRENLRVELARIRSVRRYCAQQRGCTWRLAAAAVRPRELWLALGAGRSHRQERR